MAHPANYSRSTSRRIRHYFGLEFPSDFGYSHLDIYTSLARPLLFSGLKVDPERTHQQALQWLSHLDSGDSSSNRWTRTQLQRLFSLSDRRLSQTLWGQTFANPVGLAAGFDKDGVAATIWPCFGFGFAEMGTVTWHAQPGNPQPRLFRLLQDQAVLNRMGFNNLGAQALAERLSGHATKAGQAQFPLGINLGKSKITPLEDAAQDYGNSFKALRDWGSYFVINVSSPNTPGLRSLQSTEQLRPILDTLQTLNEKRHPLLVKISPDLADEDLAAVVDLALDYQLSGIIATNTTIQRTHLRTQLLSNGKAVVDEAGGISGRPLSDRSTEAIRQIYRQSEGQLPIIGVGGVFTAKDAWNKITAGATLVQIYTGWIYEGPWMVRRILQGLLQQLDGQGVNTLEDAVGLEA